MAVIRVIPLEHCKKFFPFTTLVPPAPKPNRGDFFTPTRVYKSYSAKVPAIHEGGLIAQRMTVLNDL